MEAAVPIGAAHAEPATPSHKWLVALAVMLGTHARSARHLDRQRLAAAHAGQLLGQRRRDRVGADQLPGRQRHHDPDDRMDLVALRAQTLLHDLGVGLRGRLGAVRRGRSLDQMVVFRLIQGAAGAAMVPSSQAILMETFPPAEQQLAMATWGVGLMVAPIMGPTLGGWITDNWNWRWNFYINVPIGIIAFLMVSAFVQDPPFLRQHRARSAKVDYVGIACLVVGLGAMQIVLDRGQRADWFASPWVVWTSLLSAAALIILAINELRIADPILDLRILKIKVFSVGAGADRRDEFSALWHRPADADIPAGVHGLHGVEGRAGAGAARPCDDAVDGGGRADCAPRFRHPSAGRRGLRPDDDGPVDDVGLGPRRQPLGRRNAECCDGPRDGNDFSDALGKLRCRSWRARRSDTPRASTT